MLDLKFISITLIRLLAKSFIIYNNKLWIYWIFAKRLLKNVYNRLLGIKAGLQNPAEAKVTT